MLYRFESSIANRLTLIVSADLIQTSFESTNFHAVQKLMLPMKTFELNVDIHTLGPVLLELLIFVHVFVEYFSFFLKYFPLAFEFFLLFCMHASTDLSLLML